VRAQVKGVSTTIDLMAGMGLKYVHATNKGRKGQMGDLEKSRDQVSVLCLLCLLFCLFCFVYYYPALLIFYEVQT